METLWRSMASSPRCKKVQAFVYAVIDLDFGTLSPRFAIREFLIQAGTGLAFMLVLYLVRVQTIPELGHAAVRVFSFYSVIDCARASFRRETVWGASLNRWDQAAAYSLCATLCSLLLDWP